MKAGTLLSRAAAEALKNGLTGLEFASGIREMGGAVMMNAGAYGGEMKQVLKRAVVLTPQGEELFFGGRRAGAGIPNQHCERKGVYCFGSRAGVKKGKPEGSVPVWKT